MLARAWQSCIASLQAGGLQCSNCSDKRPVHRSHASFLSRRRVGRNLQQLCALSSTALWQHSSSRAPAYQSVDQSRRQFFGTAAASSLVATALPQAARAANETQPGVRRGRVLWHFQLRGLGPEAHARLEHVHAQVSRFVVGRSRVVDARDGAPAPRDERFVSGPPSQQWTA